MINRHRTVRNFVNTFNQTKFKISLHINSCKIIISHK